MGKNKITFGDVLQIVDKNSPAILTALVCAGTLTTAALAWVNGVKARDIIEDYKNDVNELTEEAIEESPFNQVDMQIAEPKNDDEMTQLAVQDVYKEKKRELTKKMVAGVALNAVPVVVMGGCTIACAIGANTVSTKRIAALTAAYSISEKALTDYTSKVKELIGEKKDNEVRASIAEDKVKADPPVPSKQIIMTGKGDVLCYDTYSGRYFRSDAETIRQKVNDLNEQLMDEYYISLNEFYYMLGLPPVKLGDEHGFCIDSGKMRIHFSTTLSDDNVPVLVVDYDISPKYAANKLYN